MGVDYSMTLISPVEGPEDALRSEGFVRVRAEEPFQGHDLTAQWTYVCERRFLRSTNDGPERLVERLKNMPWPHAMGLPYEPGIVLHLLWCDDFTMDDNSMAGRTRPYTPRLEVITVGVRQ